MTTETDAYSTLETAAKLAATPWDGSIELTYRCNERCAMCYLGPDWGKGRKRDELSTAEVFDLLDQIHAAGCFELLVTGGEICLRKDIIEILDYAGSKGFLMTVKTNGTMMTPELAACLTRNPVRTVDISLLGATAETHDAVTGIPGSFDKTMRGIRMLRDLDQPVKLYYTALTLNFREVIAARRLGESLGCEFEWNSQVTPRDDRSVIPLTLRLAPADQQTMMELKVDDVRGENEGDWQSNDYRDEGWFCGAGRNSFNITPYGEVQPCILMRMDCGNIRNQSFVEIWENAPEFKRLRKARISDVYGCNRCEIREYCSICPGMFFMEMGDVMMPSPHTCEMAEMKHQAANGFFKASGARDEEGNFPLPANVLYGGAGHQVVPLKAKLKAKVAAGD